MGKETTPYDETKEARADFTATHWSVVLRAAGDTSTEARAALNQLCQTYWLPTYVFVRRHGHAPEDAQDLTQAFFAELLARGDLARVDPGKGKFRSFLLACVQHFLANDRRTRRTLKRGSGQAPVPLEIELADERLAAATAEMSAERLYDQRWAMAVMSEALKCLRQEMAAAGKEPVFEALKGFLTEPAEDGAYAAVASRLDMTPGTVATTVHRLRRRYRELVRATLAQTVSTQSELEEEMRYLLEVLT